MRNFGSQPGGAAGVSVREVGKADIFIGILARRYGYVPAGVEKSVTEQEYDEAVRLRLPRLMYLLDPEHPWNKADIEADETAQARLAAFRRRVESAEVRSLFTTPEDLAAKVTADLVKLLDKQRRQTMITRILAAAVTVAALAALVLIADSGARRRLIEVVGLASPTPTATFTPTVTPTPTATPPARAPFAAHEVGVVLADFIPRDADAHNIVRPLELALERYNVPFVRVHPVADRDEALRISDLYNSTITIWGENFAFGVVVNYEITPRRSRVETGMDSELFFADLRSFSTSVLSGFDSPYVVDFILGQQAYFDNRFSEALANFDSALQQIPREREHSLRADALYFYRGGAYYFLGETEKALADIARALELNPDLSRAYFNRGVALYDAGSVGEAIANYDRAIELDPVFADAYNNRGLAYKRIEDYARALSDLNRAIELDRVDSDIFTNRGIVQRELGNYQEALQDYEQAVRLNPDDADIYYNRGIAYYALNDYAQAVSDYDTAIRLNSGDPDFYVNRGYALIPLGDSERAVKSFARAIALDPTFAAAYLGRGIARIYAAELALALDDLTRAIELDPDLADAYIYRANLAIYGEEYDLALSDLDSAFRIAPANPAIHLLRGQVYFSTRRYAEAIAEYRAYEQQAGRLEPQMEQQLAVMEAALASEEP